MVTFLTWSDVMYLWDPPLVQYTERHSCKEDEVDVVFYGDSLSSFTHKHLRMSHRNLE